MLGKEVKSVLLIMGLGTVSLTSLALPTARAVVAALPSAQSAGSPSCSGVRAMVRRSHAQLGELAADLACSYLKKIGGTQPTSVAEDARFAPQQVNRQAVEGSTAAYVLAAER